MSFAAELGRLIIEARIERMQKEAEANAARQMEVKASVTLNNPNSKPSANDNQGIVPTLDLRPFPKDLLTNKQVQTTERMAPRSVCEHHSFLKESGVLVATPSKSSSSNPAARRLGDDEHDD